MNTRKIIAILALPVAAALAYLGWLGWNAHRNLVTLNVRDMDVREVILKIERQTWEIVLLDQRVEGKVTLNVKRRPLTEVLGLVAGQTWSRPSVLYPLYSKGDSLAQLKKALRGEADANQVGWTNLQGRAFGMGGGGGPGGPGMGGMGAQAGPRQPLVSLSFNGKDISFVTLALNRFAQARVVPEDGTATTVNLILNKETVPDAVAKLADKVGRKWTTLYTLQGGGGDRGPGGPGGGRDPVAMNNGGERDRRGPRGPRGEDRPRFNPGDTNSPPSTNEARRGFGGPGRGMAAFDEMRRQREEQEKDLLNALPAEERQKLEAAQAEREKLFAEMQNMTPDQQREAMMRQMGGANISRMNRDRVMNSTPEQRAQMTQRMRQAFEQVGSGGGGPGGPGGQRRPQ